MGVEYSSRASVRLEQATAGALESPQCAGAGVVDLESPFLSSRFRTGMFNLALVLALLAHF
jgi:hypothetical protein